ncbi:hypothetical protein SYNTR_2260 [Candidatus Syntrophocurvum alkaliphilum]|uniref:Uncharacterized protein n=1 Tax=Candidatus Syntrophocurvum alkaliphilum TaxID=2293317 RepID=A0A6I6DJ86_9FIRM|nr:hypothetical protein [Candidatus Syntrophocurvum alkaliphilum]QGU00854.1 hypothetical protein SYNTR_2260 [Candidatus Syntrophocurvum alkaliphilum]
MQIPEANGVPKFIFLIIILTLAGMFTYATYFDNKQVEKVRSEQSINDFYSAYFNKDYETVANNLSVFWISRFLPEYATLTPEELIANREELVAEAADVIASIEEDNYLAATLGVDVLSEYTKNSEYSSLVVYEILEDGAIVGMEVAILIEELGQPRIFDFSQIQSYELQQILEIDLEELDETFEELLDPASSVNE